MAKPLYIGSFPPPYGGVTVKNALLFESLSEKVPLEKLNLVGVKKGNAQAISTLAKALLGREGSLAIGISLQSCLRLTRFMYRVNRAKMGRSILFVMGGRVPENEADVLKLGCYRRVYVETESMKDRFETMGAKNVSVYPNCRKRPIVPSSVRPSIGGKVKCVYFSLISEQKGAQLVLDVARNSPEMEFHFYGRIDQAFKAHFMSEVSESCERPIPRRLRFGFGGRFRRAECVRHPSFSNDVSQRRRSGGHCRDENRCRSHGCFRTRL